MPSGSASDVSDRDPSDRLGKAVDRSDIPAAGEIIADKFRVARLLGRGGMGIVLGVTHVELGTSAAIKYLPGFAEARPEELARFKREAQIAARLQSEHVVRVSDVGALASGAPYLLMECLEGEDLSATLKRDGALPIDTAIDYVLQACDAIGEAHAAGIVHRDLKPSNLFLARRRNGAPIVKVLDFGVSKLLPTAHGETGERTLTAATELVGSPLYMSPEQVESSRDIDARADVWALGVTLYKLLTNKPAFSAPSEAGIFGRILTAPAPLLRKERPDASEALEAVILRCLKKDPADRFQSIPELVAALSACRTAVPAPAREPSNPQLVAPLATTSDAVTISEVRPATPAPTAGGRTLVAGAIAAAVIVIGVGSAFVLRAGKGRTEANVVASAAVASSVVVPPASVAPPAASSVSVAPEPVASASAAPVAASPAPRVRKVKPAAAPSSGRYDDSAYGGRK